MSPLNAHELSLAVIFFTAAGFFFVFSLVPRKRTWFTLSAGAVSLLMAGTFAILSLLDTSTWYPYVLRWLATNLPFDFVILSICLAMAGRLPANLRAYALEEVVSRPRLRTILTAAPAVLLGSWFLVGVLGLSRPLPVWAGVPGPLHVLVMSIISALPKVFYCGLLGWLFLKTARRPGALLPILRAKNLVFSFGSFVLMSMVLKWLTADVAWFLWPAGNTVTDVMKLPFMEQGLLAVSMIAFLSGIVVGYVPKISEELAKEVYPNLLRLQDRLETRRWHLVNGGKVPGVTRASYYATEAAELLGMSGSDLEKTLTTIQLTAILTNPPVERERRITPEEARKLHALQKEVMADEELSSKLARSDRGSASGGTESPIPGPLHDALEAALRFTGTDPSFSVRQDIEHSTWYRLSAFTIEDVALRKNLYQTLADSPVNLRVLQAYQRAKNSTKLPAIEQA